MSFQHAPFLQWLPMIYSKLGHSGLCLWLFCLKLRYYQWRALVKRKKKCRTSLSSIWFVLCMLDCHILLTGELFCTYSHIFTEEPDTKSICWFMCEIDMESYYWLQVVADKGVELLSATFVFGLLVSSMLYFNLCIQFLPLLCVSFLC